MQNASKNAPVVLTRADCQKCYDGLMIQFDKAKSWYTEVTKLIAEYTIRRHQIEPYLQEEPLTELRDSDWLVVVEYITVYSKKDIPVAFKDGTEV